MAERVGFEPTIPLTVYMLSKHVPRTLRHTHYNFLNDTESWWESTINTNSDKRESEYLSHYWTQKQLILTCSAASAVSLVGDPQRECLNMLLQV